MNQHEVELLQELRDRAIRTESRIVQLGDHVGANLRAKQKITLGHEDNVWSVEVDSHDVSLSRILAVLRDRGITQRKVDVFIDRKLVFTLYQP